ncbi:MAG TPA: RMD1 family protein [Cyclobacteriaceae bacterium]|nr:RMD1 family protein [Cyclobacteriaceae bacterium]
MGKEITLTAFHVAKQLDLKGIRTALGKPVAEQSSELFYSFPDNRYQYYFNYGVIVFCGYTDEEMRDAMQTVEHYSRYSVSHISRDEFAILHDADASTRFEFHRVILGTLADEVFRIVMFNLAQSVALDYYANAAENLLMEIKGFTNQMERKGTLSIRRRNMMRFLGRALNTQNSIVENIYIFEVPDLVWENEYLDKLHQGLIQHFELRTRFRGVEYMMRMIEANLEVFSEILNQRESSLLEIIIILLILVEVVDFFIGKFV